ncbi:hypothetical protein IWQ62_005657 [Dispira parvispora]|uniref:Glycine zipper 2TM domain-containing protein n=1 Tax=Dispira parvispora TaxID=1520584 RepID=A0A9W8DZE5_9FUNG|nr:hypothetical protein IWQ62_005657 [Dispira parvispora]
MQCKNLIVLATVAIMALTSSTFASPTTENEANPSLQKRGVLGAAAGGYLGNKASKRFNLGKAGRLAATVGGAYLGHRLTKSQKH